jgi:hypothetical protein
VITNLNQNQPLAPVSQPQSSSPQNQSLQGGTNSASTKPQSETGKGRTKAYLRIKLGQLEFSSLNGDILGNPCIRLSSYQFSSAKIILNDPDDKIRPTLEKQQDVEIEIGFADAEKQNVLVGKLFAIGRIPPDGTEIEIIDPSAAMQNTGSSVQFANEKPVAVATTTAQDILTADTAIQQALINAGQTAESEQVNDLDRLTHQVPEQEQNNPFLSADAASFTFGAGEFNAIEATANPQSTVDTVDTQTSQQQQTQTDLAQSATQSATQNQSTNSPTAQFVAGHPGLQYANSSTSGTGNAGSVRVSQSEMRSAQNQATLTGDVVVTRGNTVRQVSPGQADKTGVVLDYKGNPSAFIGRPIITKKTGLQLQSGYGALTVTGWSPNDKRTVGATVVTPGGARAYSPDETINAPEWGQVKLGDPVVAGNMFTWADVTRNGERIPETKSVMEAAIRIAKILDQVMRDMNGGKKPEITSWYRPLWYNRQIGSSDNSRHVHGDAIDWFLPNMMSIHDAIEPSYSGGLAIKSGAFIHIDACTDPAKRRWTY